MYALRQASRTIPSMRYILRQSIWKSVDTAPTITALIEAVQNKNLPAIQHIAKKNPRLIVEQTHNDNTALHEAAKRGDVKMIEALQSEFSANFNVNHKCHCHLQRTPAHYATEGGHKSALSKLISLGADLNITDERGRTCLDYALEAKNDELAIFISEHGGKAKTQQLVAAKLPAKIALFKFTEKMKTETLPHTAKSEFDSFLNDLNATKNQPR